MAIMIPSVISPEVKSNAERKIFEWFQNAPGTDKWIVLHSLGIATHNKVIYGETDFLVLAPKLGLFALEVKGGRVKRENGIWYFTDRYDNMNRKVRGPFEQAKDGIFSIIETIKKRIDMDHHHINNVLFGYGVMFPDIEFTSAGVEDEQWQVFDSRDGSDVCQFIKRLSDGAKTKWEKLYGTNSDSKLPNFADVKYIAGLLRGDFECAVSMNIQLRNADEALIALTTEQYRCLDQLDDNARCLILGPAGSGKTLLAIEEVKRFVARGEKVALFCFNANLAGWLSNYFAEMPESLQPKFVGTLHKYMMQVTKNANLLTLDSIASEKLQQFYHEDLPAFAASALLETEELFDRIIVDEAQDLMRDSYLNVMAGCLKRGLSRGCWTLFGDFSMQAIYTDSISGTALIEKLERITSFVRFKLTINCRNTKTICKEIETVTGLKVPNDSWSKVPGPPVQYLTWSTMEDQCRKLKEVLKNLADVHIEPEKITILSPRRREDSVVSMLDGDLVKDFKVPAGMDISFCTIQAYKGLENSVIILTDIENFSAEKLMYIGLSRARTVLYVLASDSAKREYDILLMRRLLNER